ncbi:MAG TPA: hypothetical protein VE891_11805 [Allosphingosinicella sp.]|nr:hypothetical protein [Allosphingosinicella sp.]
MRLARLLAVRILSAASRLLPRHLSTWSSAMAHELIAIDDDRAALAFAAGCLRAALSLAIAARVRSAASAVRTLLFPSAPFSWSLPTMNGISARPRLLGLLCGAAAVGIGMAYMQAAGAPSRYLLVNLAALVLGATAWLALGGAARSRLAGSGRATLAMSAALLMTAGFGVAAEGASRWVSVGPLTLQVSLILLPVMIILYARRPDAPGTGGMAVAALALALQPDRAMAGVLAAAMIVVGIENRRRLPILAASVSAAAFGWTLIRPDSLGATAFVDRVLYTAFDVHPLAGAAVAIGAAALVVPAAAGLWKGAGDRSALLAFGACWSAAVAAAALGNCPTPLVGYGGSAVLGYLLSVSLLPGGARRGEAAAFGSSAPRGPGPDDILSELRAAPSA